ncbi:MAG: sulfatase [Anaerolineaceae bacterium]|nr:sulfatase [Anaerolineaceae bacterium]
MKAIMVMFDSLNRRYLPPYGCDWVRAPNFERLAQRAVTFDNCYSGSMPCMPARRELHTGRYNFLHRSWGPIEPFDDSMPEILKQNRVYTHLISDHQHYWEDGGATYHNRYSSWEIVRGQEGDLWKGHVPVGEEWDAAQGVFSNMKRQDQINRQYMPTEAEHSQTRVFNHGLHFIQTNCEKDDWFLQIETFDPHEPFFVHDHYKEQYAHDYDGPDFDWPPYGRVTESPEKVEHTRKTYAALVSMCDHSLGRVLDTMDAHDMWQDTMLIVCTDHGYLLGEHNWWAKSVQPFYNEVVHTPFFVWDPRSGLKGERRDDLVQMIDVPPTLLDYFGVARPSDMQGLPLGATAAAVAPAREAILYGSHGGHINVTDGRYTYLRAPKTEVNKPLYDYTHMPTHMRARFSVAEMQNMEIAEPFSFTKGCRTMKIPAGAGMLNPHLYGTLLFDLQTDPGQEKPIVDEAVERRMIKQMVALMRANDAPPEQYERLNLPPDGVVAPHHLQLAAQHELALQALHPPKIEVGDGHFNLNTPIKDLLADVGAAAVFQHHFPEFSDDPFLKQAAGASPLQISNFAPGLFTANKLNAMAADLALLDENESVLSRR